VKLKGGLGNQLFQWACGYKLSFDHEVYFDNSFYANKSEKEIKERNWKFDLDKILSQNIPLCNKDIKKKFSEKTIRKIGDNFHFNNLKFDEKYNYLLDGHWQSEKYFKNVKEKIYNMMIKKSFAGFDFLNSCSIHVRRGDYLNTPDIYPAQPIDFYKKALDIIQPKGKIFIFSDDINWCKKNFKFKNMIFVEGNSNIEDLLCMSLCGNNIIANSTFSWWGAYLNQNKNKIVVYPDTWFGPAVRKSIKDLFPGNWIKI
jgi:hypothetical protein